MDHIYIEEHGLVERYHRGDLPAEEEVRFEEHFMACAECQERLALARSLRKGIRAMAAEDAVRRRALETGLLAWLARRGHGARAGLAVAALLATIVTAGWLLLENRPPAGSAGVSPSVLVLSAYRDGGGGPGAVHDPGKTGERPLALALDVGEGSRFESFRVTIEDEGGKRVFVREGLRPNALEVLMLSFPADFFQPGNYRLSVAGLEAEGRAVELESYPFHVAGAP